MFVASILLMVTTCTISQFPPKHPLENECVHNNLGSGTYRCFLPDAGISFFVDCMVDGTMYINPSHQALYHYHKQNGNNVNFKMILSAEYNSLNDIDYNAIPKLEDLNALDEDIEDIPSTDDANTDADADADADETLNDDSLDSDDLSESQKLGVNLTAQYIVYGVIGLMGSIFVFGVFLLIFWWCCRHRIISHNNDNILADLDIDDETKPFIDIRSRNTIHRKALKMGNTLYFGINERNVYDDIMNTSNDNEDGDDLIAHYGSTDTNPNINNDGAKDDGYVIASFPNKNGN